MEEKNTEKAILEAHKRALSIAGNAIDELKGDSLEVMMMVSSLVLWLTTESPSSKKLNLEYVLDTVRHSVVSGGDRRPH